MPERSALDVLRGCPADVAPGSDEALAHALMDTALRGDWNTVSLLEKVAAPARREPDPLDRLEERMDYLADAVVRVLPCAEHERG